MMLSRSIETMFPEKAGQMNQGGWNNRQGVLISEQCFFRSHEDSKVPFV
jgi:hypothetical protein